MPQVKKTSSQKCYQCGSDLILVKKITEKIEGSHFPQTTTIYRCSNKVCQDEKDKQEEKRLKLKEEKQAQDEIRAKEKLTQKKGKKVNKKTNIRI